MTTRVLIVDDEILVRVALKTLIPWEEHGFEIIGEAANGVEALELLSREACHIILSDIRMPEMNGLDFMNHVRVRWPETKFIILSNHNDFEYVQKALRLGAADYTLKLAYTPEELLDKCKRLQQSLRSEQQERSEKNKLDYKIKYLERKSTELTLLDLLVKQRSRLEVDHLHRDGMLPPFVLEGCRVIVAAVDNYQQVLEENRFQSEQLLIYTVSNIFAELLKKYEQCQLVDMHNRKLVILAGSYSEDMLDELKAAGGTFAKVNVSFGVSRDSFSAYQLNEGFRQAEQALSRRFFHEGRHILYPLEDDEVQPKVSILQSGHWNGLLETADRDVILEELRLWIALLQEEEGMGAAWVREQWLQWLHLVCLQMGQPDNILYVMPEHQERYPFDVIRNAETLREIGDWFFGWLPAAVALMGQSSQPVYRDEVKEIIRIMEEEYASSLKVSDLAKRAGFAENYLSVMFKKETGVKIVDYLTQIRMQKARELLRNPTYKIYEISEMVGYADSNHFSKYFKKIEGLFPLEYRKTMTGRKQGSLENPSKTKE
ncbi:response regulator [Paenibacillus sp. S150]|uniref:response regulator n=1 Tax=Paenibacillus sp. S150 TaxID=2749826 RepID=UPI001C575CE3|nr:response regulator [Paenibacillus sp. S150]MBW4084329.1 response regulator [Paenibacillus sp. S150]